MIGESLRKTLPPKRKRPEEAETLLTMLSPEEMEQLLRATEESPWFIVWGLVRRDRNPPRRNVGVDVECHRLGPPRGRDSASVEWPGEPGPYQTDRGT